jgi:hypothetical protein
MRGTRSNGQPTRVKDPDWRPSIQRPAYWPLPSIQPLAVCGRCLAAIPDSDRAKQGHRQWHEQLAEQVEAGLPR